MKYILSPEFHRHVWTRMTLVPVLIMPVLIVLGLWVVLAQSDNWADALKDTSLLLFCVSVYLWGNMEAASAFKDEIRGKTWDFQRMSSIGPWQLAMGKLFGATSYTWYVGAIFLGLLVYACASVNLGLADIYLLLVFLILAGLLGQMTAFWLAMEGLRGGGTSTGGAALAGLFVSYCAAEPAKWLIFSADKPNIFDNRNDIEWWGISVSLEHLYLFTALMMLYFLIAAIYRQMRLELQFRNTPVVWAFFHIVMVIYTSGFLYGATDTGIETACMMAGVAFFITAFLCYSGLVSNSYDLAMYKRLILALRNGQGRRAAENTPRWPVSGVFMLLAFIAALVFFNLEDSEKSAHALTFMFCIILFMARDGLVLHALTLRARDGRRGTFYIICYYAMMYLLLPGFILTLSGENPFRVIPDVTGENGALVKGIFYPTLNQPWYAVTPWIMAQVAAAALVLHWKLRGKKSSTIS